MLTKHAHDQNQLDSLFNIQFIFSFSTLKGLKKQYTVIKGARDKYKKTSRSPNDTACWGYNL
jgi:hypothetical protein